MKQSTLKKITLICGGLFCGIGILWIAKTSLKPVVRNTCGWIIKYTEDEKKFLKRTLSPVEAIKAIPGGISKRIKTVGKLKANNSVVIKSEVSGRIEEILFQEGSEVNKGDILVKFKNSGVAAELKQAQAKYITAKAAYERSLKLSDKKIESSQKFEEAKGNMLMAEAKVDSAKADLEKTIIKAPFQGSVGIINFGVGAYVEAGKEIVALVDNTPIKIDFKVPEKFIHEIGEGQTINLKIDGFNDDKFVGIVESIDSRIDPASHSIRIKGRVDNEAGHLKEGMFANISVSIGQNENALIVPESSVDREGDIDFVWVVERGKAERRRVLVGTREDGKVEISAGLRDGEIVVTSGQIRLTAGSPVKITNVPSLNSDEVKEIVEKEAEEKKKIEEEKKKEEESAAKIKKESEKKNAENNSSDNKNES